jgi:hypothetical protein
MRCEVRDEGTRVRLGLTLAELPVQHVHGRQADPFPAGSDVVGTQNALKRHDADDVMEGIRWGRWSEKKLNPSDEW